MNNFGLLNKMKCTIIGPMQYCPEQGQLDREYISNILKKEFNVITFNHYDNPFLSNFKEDIDSIKNLNKLILEENYEEVEKFKYIRLNDLSLIDRSDFVIFLYDKKTPMCGAFEEFFVANKLKKPIFVICKDGKKNSSAWLFWTISHKYMYNSIEECLEILRKINNKTIDVDFDRWKLLKLEYR